MTAAIVLAAGRSQRYGRANKLLEVTSERPLIAHVLDVLDAAEPADSGGFFAWDKKPIPW